MMKDEIRAQKERVKQMSRRERFKYFWYYQWKWVALAVTVIAFLCYLGFMSMSHSSTAISPNRSKVRSL